jgi:ribonuclease R
MAKHIGEEFEGKVNGLNVNGFFVQLFHPYCEGMVPVESLEDDWYEYQEERMMMVGRKRKRSFQIGQPVKIQVVRVDLDARQIEFKLLEVEKEKVADGEEEFEY